MRAYLDTTVMPVLRKALRELVKQRWVALVRLFAKFITKQQQANHDSYANRSIKSNLSD